MLSTEFCMATKGDRICRISWVFLINFQALEGFLAALVQCIILMFVWARYVANWFAGMLSPANIAMQLLLPLMYWTTY